VQRRVVELFDLVRVIQADLFPGYQIGPSLRTQPGSTPFRRRLERALKFMRAVGLIDGSVLGDHHYAHTSVMLLMMRALGVHDPRLLVPYIRNPGSFLAWATVNGLGLDDAARTAVQRELASALWLAAERYIPTMTDAPVPVAFPAEYGDKFLRHVQVGCAEVTGRLTKLVTRLGFRRMGAIPPSEVDGAEFGGQSSQGGEGENGGGRPDMVSMVSWEDFLERERKKLERETRLFEQHRDEWLRTHEGQFVVIHGSAYSFHATERDALRAGYELARGDAPFLVERLIARPPVSFVAALG